MSKFLILWLIDFFPAFVPPEVEEIVSKKFELSLQLFIIFSHLADFLFECFYVCFFFTPKMEFENLDFELHFSIIVERDALILPFVDPSVTLFEILSIKIGLTSEFVLSFGAFDSDIQIWN
jgi:hypothetical protein